MSKTVFITGATGYIGGAILACLLETSSTKNYAYRALVRSKDKAARLEKFGVHPVIATLDDAAVLTAEAERADIVVHTADSADHLPSSQAILSGMKKRDDRPILIHIVSDIGHISLPSHIKLIILGKGVLVDDARGEHGTDEVFSDLDPKRINSLPDSAFHRNVDLNVLEATSLVRTHIVLPPTIYGIADHSLVKAGISNPISISIPALIRVGIDRGQGGYVGKGLNVWPNVHVEDIATAIVMVLAAAVEGKTATGSEGYYFGETGEHRLYDVCAEISRALSVHGIGKPEPIPFTEAEIQKYYGGSYFMGSNARCKAERTRQLGWSSTRTTADLMKSIVPEVDYILKIEGGKGL